MPLRQNTLQRLLRWDFWIRLRSSEVHSRPSWVLTEDEISIGIGIGTFHRIRNKPLLLSRNLAPVTANLTPEVDKSSRGAPRDPYFGQVMIGSDSTPRRHLSHSTERSGPPREARSTEVAANIRLGSPRNIRDKGRSRAITGLALTVP